MDKCMNCFGKLCMFVQLLFGMEKEILQELVTMEMPYGRYKGRILCDLPEPYLAWYYEKGFPKGKLGERLALMYEIKLNGLEYLLKEIKRRL